MIEYLSCPKNLLRVSTQLLLAGLALLLVGVVVATGWQREQAAVEGGNLPASNVVPDKVILTGTVRTYDKAGVVSATNTVSTRALTVGGVALASAEKAAYVAAKHGIVGLTKVTALENARTNVTCNALCPGWVMTPLVEAQIKARAERDGLDYAEAKRLLQPMR